MSARPAGRRTHPPLTVEGTDDQKDLSSAIAENVCLPDAPGRSEVGRSEIRDQKPSLVCRISPATECVTSSQCQTPARKPKRAAGEFPQRLRSSHESAIGC